MTDKAIRRNGPYGPLSAYYYDDDAIIEAGPDAETLFTRSIAFCARTPSDGFMTNAQVNVTIGRGLPRLQQRVESLVKHGLWVIVDGGYQLRSYLKWNRSAAEIGRVKAKDRARKARTADEESGALPLDFREELERSPDGASLDSESSRAGARAGASHQGRADQDSPPSSRAEGDGPDQPLTDEACPAIVDSMRDERRRGTRITADWRPSDDMRAWTLEHLTSEQAAAELDRFRDFWTAKAGRDAVKLDWDATWRNWIRTSIERRGTPARRPVPVPSGPAGVIDRSEFVGVPA